MDPMDFLMRPLVFSFITTFSLSELQSSAAEASDGDVSMEIYCEGALEGEIKRISAVRSIANGDSADIGGDLIGVVGDGKEASDGQSGDGVTSPEVQWILDNYREPDIRRVMTSIILFVWGYDPLNGDYSRWPDGQLQLLIQIMHPMRPRMLQIHPQVLPHPQSQHNLKISRETELIHAIFLLPMSQPQMNFH